jgi:hypothetical protein
MKKSKNTLIKYSKRHTKTKTKRINRRSNKRINRRSNKRINRRSNKRIKKRSNKSNNKSKRKKNSFKRNLIKKSKSKLIGGDTNKCGEINAEGMVVRDKLPGCFLPTPETRTCHTKEGILCPDNYDVDDKCVCTPGTGPTNKHYATCKKKPPPKSICKGNINKNMASIYEDGRMKYIRDKMNEFIENEGIFPINHLGRQLVQAFNYKFWVSGFDGEIDKVSTDHSGGSTNPFDFKFTFKNNEDGKKFRTQLERKPIWKKIKGVQVDTQQNYKKIQVEEKGKLSIDLGINIPKYQDIPKNIPILLSSLNDTHSKLWTPQSINPQLHIFNENFFNEYTNIFWQEVIKKLPKLSGVDVDPATEITLLQFRNTAKKLQIKEDDASKNPDGYSPYFYAFKKSDIDKSHIRVWEYQANSRFLDDWNKNKKLNNLTLLESARRYCEKYKQKDYWLSTAGVPKGMKNKRDAEKNEFYLDERTEKLHDVIEAIDKGNINEEVKNVLNDMISKIDAEPAETEIEQVEQVLNDMVNKIPGMTYTDGDEECEDLPPLVSDDGDEYLQPTHEPETDSSGDELGGGGSASSEDAQEPCAEDAAGNSSHVQQIDNAIYVNDEKFAFCWHEGYQDWDVSSFCPTKAELVQDQWVPPFGKPNYYGFLKIRWSFQYFDNDDQQIRFRNGGYANLSTGI